MLQFLIMLFGRSNLVVARLLLASRLVLVARLLVVAPLTLLLPALLALAGPLPVASGFPLPVAPVFLTALAGPFPLASGFPLPAASGFPLPAALASRALRLALRSRSFGCPNVSWRIGPVIHGKKLPLETALPPNTTSTSPLPLPLSPGSGCRIPLRFGGRGAGAPAFFQCRGPGRRLLGPRG